MAESENVMMNEVGMAEEKAEQAVASTRYHKFTGLSIVDDVLQNDNTRMLVAGVGAAAIGYLVYRIMNGKGEGQDPPSDPNDPPTDPNEPPTPPLPPSPVGSTVIIDPWAEGYGTSSDDVSTCASWKLSQWYFRASQANQAMAGAVGRHLASRGINVLYTMPEVAEMSLRDRAGVISRSNADAFIIMRHGIYGTDGRGALVYPGTPNNVFEKSRRMAITVSSHMTFPFKFNLRMTSQEFRGTFNENQSSGGLPEPIFDYLRQLNSGIPGLIIEPAALRSCLWQDRYLTSLKFGGHALGTYVDIYGSKIAYGIAKYINESKGVSS